MTTKLSQRCCALSWLLAGIVEIVASEVGAVLRHVITVPDWSPESVPKDFPASIGRSYVAIFEKAR